MSEGADEPAETREKGGVLSALKGMVSFFTVIRIPVDMKEFDAMERNFWLAPVIGLLVGVVSFAVCAVLGFLKFNILVLCVFALATPYLFSKFLHFDGLTDFGDGMICSSGDREKHVRALKDTLVGAGGVGVAIVTIVLTVVLYFQVAADYASVAGSGFKSYVLLATVVLVCEVLVKNAQVSAAAFGLPGSGMASRQVSCTTIKSMVLSTCISAVAVLGILALMEVLNVASFCIAVPTIAALLMSVVTGWWMARTANRNFGFVNGDILGATNEISRVVVLFTLALVLSVM